MLFNSVSFLVFFPVVTLLYYRVPVRMKNVWLLFASYFFYMCWNVKYGLLLFGITLASYTGGILVRPGKEKSDSEGSKYRRTILAVCIFLILSVLFFFKYWNFTVDLVVRAADFIKIDLAERHIDVILPVGISFFTFQALGYVIDVYRGDTPAEKNFVTYALFVSFFPQLVAGPIERSGNLLKQLSKIPKYDSEKARDGFLLMIWGYFLKIVVADKAAIFINTVYGNTAEYGGCFIITATLLFAVQVYCDFAGYTVIAMGAAEILGIRLMDNFKSPYLSVSVQEFWSNWHISLTSWFRDYLYIPLGGNRKGQFRKQINKLIVFFVSGLWHGADLSFVVWGLLNGVYQILGEVLKPIRDLAVKILKIDRKSIGHRVVQMLMTFLLVDFSWVFFRADNIYEARKCIASMFTVYNPWIFFDGTILECGLDYPDMLVLLFSIGLVLMVDICKKKGICLRRVLMQQHFLIYSIVVPIFICFILLFGVWGSEFDAARFIYFQF